MEGLGDVFAAGRKSGSGQDALVKELYAKIGELTVERDFSARVGELRRSERLAMVERDGALSPSRQCELLDVGRASLYREPAGESEANLALMRRIDELHMDCPLYGSRQMSRHLRREGVVAGRHRIRRLMRLMGLEAVYRKPRTSEPHPGHEVHPYLLRGVAVERPDQVWCADITYIPVRSGFLYLVAAMDWATRFVLAWRLSNTMDAAFCVEALEAALSGGAVPDAFNTDQGAQFTSLAFAGRVLASGARCSWRSLKYEAVYLRDIADGFDAERVVADWMRFYNHVRPHSSLGGRTPAEAYRGGAALADAA